MAKQIYGKLLNEDTYVPLEIAENEKEQLDIQKEYANVYGNQIEFWERKITAEELAIAKRYAFAKLLQTLKN
jgi:hypothetical protein